MISPRAKLRKYISENFNMSEIQNLCFDLNIDIENLNGQTKNDKSRAIIEFCERSGLLHLLFEWCKSHRPQIIWLTADERLLLFNNTTSKNEADDKVDISKASSESEEEKQLNLLFESILAYFSLDIKDIDSYLELFSSKLLQVIPERTEILQKGGFFTKKKLIKQIIIFLNDWQFVIENSGQFFCYRIQVVQGITLKTEILILNDWVRMLSTELTILAQNHQNLKSFFLNSE